MSTAPQTLEDKDFRSATGSDDELQELEIQIKRLEIDERKANQKQSFIKKNLSFVITAMISVAALLVSATQIWVANISRNRELENARIQKDKETENARIQKDKEMDMEQAKQSQEWNIRLATFISENKVGVFSDKEVDRVRMRELILATFPNEKAKEVFNKLANLTNNSEAKKTWNEGEQTADNLRSKLIKDMFSDDKSTRIAATTKLFREGSRDSELVPMILDYAGKNTSNKSGVINSLVVLQNVDPDLLRAIHDQVESFLNSVKEPGGQTIDQINKVRSRMNQ